MYSTTIKQKKPKETLSTVKSNPSTNQIIITVLQTTIINNRKDKDNHKKKSNNKWTRLDTTREKERDKQELEIVTLSCGHHHKNNKNFEFTTFFRSFYLYYHPPHSHPHPHTYPHHTNQSPIPSRGSWSLSCVASRTCVYSKELCQCGFEGKGKFTDRNKNIDKNENDKLNSICRKKEKIQVTRHVPRVRLYFYRICSLDSSSPPPSPPHRSLFHSCSTCIRTCNPTWTSASTLLSCRFPVGMSHYEVSDCGSSAHYHHHHSAKNHSAVAEVNNHVAQFRDLLIHIGQSRDGPEMREKIRRMRRLCIDSCRHAVHLLLQQVRSDASEGIPVDYSPQLVLLFFCTQLLCRELRKCRRLVMTLPIDMTAYYAENRPGPSSLGGVLSQIILCRQLNPDFNQEELCSIDKDTVEISDLLDEMQEFMPKENTQTLALAGEDVFSKWARRRRKKSMYCHFGSLCCVSKSGRFTV